MVVKSGNYCGRATTVRIVKKIYCLLISTNKINIDLMSFQSGWRFAVPPRTGLRVMTLDQLLAVASIAIGRVLPTTLSR